MYFVTTWDGTASKTYSIKASNVCEARIKARRKHIIQQHVDWCEITKISHRIDV